MDHCEQGGNSNNSSSARTGLKKIKPYWYPYRTMAKGRWFDREILEMVSTEFRDRSVEYYRYALESGVTTVNGKIAKPGTIIRNGDRIENIVHRHEPPVTSTPVRILLHDKDREFVVIDKPGSIPVHATGRYFKHSLVEILKDDFGFKSVHTVNRLDRLTSGLMIIATSADRARMLTGEFTAGTILKEYIARVNGCFPEAEVRCSEPLLTVDRQMGLNIVHPEGKHAETIFQRMFYDEDTQTSVVHCRPLTGRSHQIRVHLQFLGYPIANDPVYSDKRIWGEKLGKGGIDLTPSEERSAPVPPPAFGASEAEGLHRNDQRITDMVPIGPNRGESTFASTKTHERDEPSANGSRIDKPRVKKIKSSPAWRTKEESAALVAALHAQLQLSAPAVEVDESSDSGAQDSAVKLNGEFSKAVSKRLLPRETGHDIGMGSPVPLSKEAVDVIRRLRNQKDEDEDWSRWRDVVFKTKGALNPAQISLPGLPPQNKRRRGGDGGGGGVVVLGSKRGEHAALASSKSDETAVKTGDDCEDIREDPFQADAGDGYRDASQRLADAIMTLSATSSTHSEPSAVIDTVPSRIPISPPPSIIGANETEAATEATYCPECYLPLHPDPKPEKLYIFLHALRYTTSFGAFETIMPEWAVKGWQWDRGDESTG